MKRALIIIVCSLILFFFLPLKTVRCGAIIGMVKWEGKSHSGVPVMLPFPIMLDSVSVSYHPYYLYAVNVDSKKPLPEGKPDRMDIAAGNGKLAGWKIRVDTLLWSASLIETSDTLLYTAFGFAGGAPAAHLSAESDKGYDRADGWVCCGSALFKPKSLKLNGDTSIVFINHQVKEISSIIRIGLPDSLSTERYSLRGGRLKYIRGCFISQVTPDFYGDTDTGTSDYTIRITPFGIIVSRYFLSSLRNSL